LGEPGCTGYPFVMGMTECAPAPTSPRVEGSEEERRKTAVPSTALPAESDLS